MTDEHGNPIPIKCRFHYENCPSASVTRKSIYGAVLNACEEAWARVDLKLWPEVTA